MGSFREALPQQDFIRVALGTIRRQKLLVILGGLGLFIVTALGIQALPKTYRGTASVEVLSKTPTVASPDILTNDQQFTDETVGTEIAILESHELREAVIRRLRLVAEPEFNPGIKPSWAHLATEKIAAAWSTLDLARWFPSAAPPSSEKEQFEVNEALSKAVKIEPVSHSRIIQVHANSANPKLAAAIANAYVNEFVAIHQGLKESAYKQAYDFSSARLPGLRADMLAKSAAVDSFRQKNNMVSGQFAAIRREQLTEQTRQLVVAQNRLEELKALNTQAKTGDILGNPAVLNSLLIGRLREEESRLFAEGVGRGAAWQAERTQAVKANIRAEAKRIVDSLPGQVAAQQATVAQQAAAVATIQKEVARIDMLQSELDPLENDARIAQKQYTDFLSSDSATKPDVAFTAVNVRVLSPATVPYKAYFPDNRLMLPAALVLSFAGSTALALRRGRRTGFGTLTEFEETFQVEPIGQIPHYGRQADSVYIDSVSFLSMRLCSPYSRDRQTILVTSARPDEGKTTIAWDLARAFARRAVSVALVDADMRMSRAKSKRGLADLLEGTARATDVARTIDGVTFVPAGLRPNAPASLIASDAMPLLLNELQGTHDVVIIDAPPASVGGDVWALSKLVQRVLLVVKHNETTRQQIENALRMLDKGGAELAVVLNMVRATPGDEDHMFSPSMLKYYAFEPRAEKR